MSRTLAFLLALLIATLPAMPSYSQTTRNRLQQQTQAVAPTESPPSFRGGAYGGTVQVTGQPGLPQQVAQPQIPIVSGAMEGSVGASVIGMNYQVHILGEVANPGTYRVAASDRVSEIINRAGGLSQYASERNIQLKRKDGGTRVIDLMEFRLHGKLEENPYVTDNDVIYVPLADKLVQIVGSVKRPNYYELKKENTLAQVIDLAGGFNAAAAVSQPIKVVRFVNGEKTINDVPINNDEMDKYAILNGDVIVVPNLVTKDTEFDYNISAIPGDQLFYPSYEDRVFVLGGVTFPGAYPFSQYYMLNQYVSLAGGLSDRGGPKYKVIGVDGKIRKASATDRVNPGDTIMVKEHWLSPAGWMMFGMSLASFGLSASSTALALTRR